MKQVLRTNAPVTSAILALSFLITLGFTGVAQATGSSISIGNTDGTVFKADQQTSR